MKMNKLSNETAFQKFIRKSFAYSFHERCSLKKNHGNMYSEAGVADIDGHVLGKYIALEAKMWQGRPTTQQMSFARKITRTGGIHFFLIYRFTPQYNGPNRIHEQAHDFFWVPGVMGVSYRMSHLWPRTSVVYVNEIPNDLTSKMTPIMDCSPITTMLEMGKE